MKDTYPGKGYNDICAMHWHEHLCSHIIWKISLDPQMMFYEFRAIQTTTKDIMRK